eukprot:scaffold8453_cov131-Amphora_coffeaeformis.AAC.1
MIQEIINETKYAITLATTATTAMYHTLSIHLIDDSSIKERHDYLHEEDGNQDFACRVVIRDPGGVRPTHLHHLLLLGRPEFFRFSTSRRRPKQ